MHWCAFDERSAASAMPITGSGRLVTGLETHLAGSGMLFAASAMLFAPSGMPLEAMPMPLTGLQGPVVSFEVNPFVVMPRFVLRHVRTEARFVDDAVEQVLPRVPRLQHQARMVEVVA